MEMVHKLQEEERGLDYREEIKEKERRGREEREKQAMEAESAEEVRMQNDTKMQDWTDEVENDLSENFRQRCQNRLKKNDNLNWIAYSERFKNLKMIKNMLTIKIPSKAWIKAYAVMERERYKNPTKPWLYYNPDRTTNIVAPVLRKIGQATSKAREHNALR